MLSFIANSDGSAGNGKGCIRRGCGVGSLALIFRNQLFVAGSEPGFREEENIRFA